MDVITDLDPDLFVEWNTSHLWYFRGRVKVMHSAAHYPLRCSRGIFFYQNAVLIDGLRFMSRSSDMITHATRPSIHIFFFASQFIPLLSLFTCSPSTPSLSHHHYPPICSLPHVSYLFAPSLPTTLISSYSPPFLPSPPLLHLSARAQ